MIPKIRKIIAVAGLVALCVAPAIAGSFSLSTYSGSNAGTAVVPTLAGCGQVLMAPYGWSYVTSYGPLGNFASYGPMQNSWSTSGQIPAGTYYCSVSVSGGGYASVEIRW